MLAKRKSMEPSSRFLEARGTMKVYRDVLKSDLGPALHRDGRCEDHGTTDRAR